MEIVEALADGGATEGEILSLESELGAVLPEPYRLFLMQANGGRPEPSAFRFQTTNDESDSLVDWFYTLAPDDDYNIRDNLDIFRDRIPVGLMPVACDPFGNQILLGVQGQHGAVFFWDHELESSDDPNWDNVSRIASSFSEFLGMLG